MDHTSSKSLMAKSHEGHMLGKWNKNETFPYKINTISKNSEDQLMLGGTPPFMAAAVDLGKLMSTADEVVGEVATPPPCGGERVKKYWGELATRRVYIPESWNQEGLLMDWIDYSSFDSLLAPKGIDSARKALIAEAQRAHQQEKRF